jgi:two-component sensor histidine kinase
MKTISLYISGLLLLIQQGSVLDSLQNKIENTKDDNLKLELYWEAAKVSLDEDVKRTKDFTSYLITHPKVKEDSTQLVKAIRYQATAERWLGNYVQSIKEFSVCYDYYKKSADTTNLAFVNSYLGAMNVFMGYHEEAQKYLLERYELLKAGNNTSALASAVNGLAIFYSNIGQNSKALERYQEALSLYEKVDDTLGKASIHANLGLFYMDEGDLEKAEYHLKIQGSLDSLVNDVRGLGFHFDFMGSLKSMQGKKEEALKYHLTALKIRESLPSLYNISESRAGLAKIQSELGMHEEAIFQAQKILETRFETQSLSHQERAYDVLAESYEKMGNFKLALENLKNYKKISDSIYNKDLAEILAEKDAKFDLVENRSKIAVLDAENEASKQIIKQKNRTLLILVLAIGVFLVLVIVLYLLSRKYLNQKIALSKALADKDILLKEIHHRVKNNLQLVSSLLTLQGQTITDDAALKAINEGKSRVRSMALIHQDLYQTEKITTVSAQTYLLKLCNELFDTYNIDKKQISLKTNIQSIDIDVDTLIPIGLIINELITNSIKYAFKDQQEGIIEIELKETNNMLVLNVIDNGVGYNVEQLNTNTFGNNLIKSLTQQLDGTLKIMNDNGTKVLMEFSDYKIYPQSNK